MKHTLFIKAAAMFAAFASALAVSAEGEYEAIGLKVNVANNHLWRGIEVSDGLVLTASLGIHDKKDRLHFGLWGGTNTSGKYKEMNYFAEMKHGGWKLALWDIYNFSPGAEYNNREYFNYSARSTGRFLDAILSYTFPKKFPLTVSWSTVVFGRDRNETNSANKYSTFVYAEYPFTIKEKWRLLLGGGGAFALNKAGSPSTFYSTRPGIVHVEMRLERTLKITKRYSLPLHVSAVWNPECNRAYLQIAATVLSL
ncbi:MAG: hypothetical protein ACI3ZA_08935 [Alloprevotella sp.]